MIDTQKIRKERWTSSGMIHKLCDEVDQLRKTPQPPTRVGKVIDEQKGEIARLKKEKCLLEGIVGFCAGYREIAEKEIAELKDRLEVARNSIINQEKEITELKAELMVARNNLLKEGMRVNELKVELNAINGACTHLIPRQKLTEAIEKIIKSSRSCNHQIEDNLCQALREYGTK